MDLKELKDILQILEEKEIAEFELETGGMKLRIKTAAAFQPAPAPAGNPAAPPVPPSPPTTSRPGPVAAGPTPVAVPDDAPVVVKSPIVGTFYRSTDPNSPPLVSLGDRVKLGQVLCIIEAMKLMNEIEAEVAGEVVEILHENGQPVQYGEPIFAIRPDR